MNYAINNTLLKNIINSNSLLIDLRDPYLYNKSHIKNFINIPIHSFVNIYLPKNKPIYLVCQSGKLAKDQTIRLRQDNYEVYYIEGGMNNLLNIPPTIYY